MPGRLLGYFKDWEEAVEAQLKDKGEKYLRRLDGVNLGAKFGSLSDILKNCEF